MRWYCRCFLLHWAWLSRFGMRTWVPLASSSRSPSQTTLSAPSLAASSSCTLGVRNCPRRCPLVPQRTAHGCHGRIRFLTMDGQQLTPPMVIRWAGNPEPLKAELAPNGQLVNVPDAQLTRISGYMDIPPNEIENIDVCMRIAGDPTAYGWTAESYWHPMATSRLRGPGTEIPGRDHRDHWGRHFQDRFHSGELRFIGQFHTPTRTVILLL